MKKYFVVSKLSENMHETPEGFLLCVGVPIARSGTMLYGEGETPLEADEEGLLEITRDESEVFRPQTIASFEGKPVTIAHPNEFVTKDNWSRLAKGVTQNVRRGVADQASDLIADLLITDAVAIQLIKSGLREVSCGYEAEYTQTGKGKGSQSNIIGNHVALVDEGRAGSEYAIKDHKGVTTMDKKTLLEKLMAVVGITRDEAKKLVHDEAPVETPPDKKAQDAGAYDALMKAVSDLNAMVSAMANPTEAAADDVPPPPAAPPVAEDAPDDNSLEARLAKLEAAVSKLLERESKEDEVPVDDEDVDKPVITDEEMEESEDEDMEEEEAQDAACTGDTASRVEILAPGLEAKGKDIKAKALKACYGTKEGKVIIEQLNGGKAPAFDSAEKVEMLFAATSEVLKAQRNKDMTRTRQVRDLELIDGTPRDREMTAEKMNELNAKHYKTRS